MGSGGIICFKSDYCLGSGGWISETS